MKRKCLGNRKWGKVNLSLCAQYELESMEEKVNISIALWN